MKKLVALLLSVVCLCSLCSCSGKTEDTFTTSQRNVIITREDLEKQVLTGKLDTATFATGSSFDTVKKHFLDLVDSYKNIPGQPAEHVTLIGENEERYEFRMGYIFSYIIYQDQQYYFVNGKESQGVAAVVSKAKDGAFGFKVGNCPEEDIINSLGKADFTDVPEPNSYNICVPNNSPAKRLTYMFENYRLDFMLADYGDGLGYTLSAVILTDTNIYSDYTTTPASPTESTIG